MKVKFAFLVFCCMALLIGSCKHDIDETTDCVTQTLFAEIVRTFDSADRKTVHLALNYTGTKTVTSIKWIFGDGISTTTSDTVVTHNYADTGIYIINADVNLQQGNNDCAITSKKIIHIK